jgi:transposase
MRNGEAAVDALLDVRNLQSVGKLFQGDVTHDDAPNGSQFTTYSGTFPCKLGRVSSLGLFASILKQCKPGQSCPVTLAHIDGSLYLVDGWHRVTAALGNNQYLIWADVSETTFNEARWYAAKANTEHGLPLKTKELREVFRAFIETNRHMQGQRLMPYREIAKRIGKGFSTIRNWMKADYPRLFEKYQQMANSAPDEMDFDREAKIMERRLTKAEADIRNVRNTGRTLDPENLGKLIHALRETLSDLETKPYEPVEFVVDF